MWAALGWSAWLLVAPAQDARRTESPLVPLVERQKLRSLGGDLARAGEGEGLATVRAVLLALGDDPEDLDRLAAGWARTLEQTKASRPRRTALASKLERLLEPLAAHLLSAEEPRRGELARALLALDSGNEAARTARGHVRGADGVWRTPEEARWDEGARAVEGRVRGALALDYDIERGESTNPTLLAVAGGGRFVRAEGVELHSALDWAPLERVLRQALRAAELSRAVTGDAAPARKREPQRFVLLTTRAHERPAREEAAANGGLTPEGLALQAQVDLVSYLDLRGFEVVRWTNEATFAVVVLWRLHRDWLPLDAQPCLRIGHLNWLCLRALGTGLPGIVWETAGAGAEERSNATREDAAQREFRWRAAQQTLWGCRSWMARQVEEGRDPPWARTMLDQDGKIRDELLLKATLVYELLQQEGRVVELLAATKGSREPIPAFEQALGAPLPELEARWRRWLAPERPVGLLQELATPAVPDAGDAAAEALRILNQARANALAGQGPEVPLVVLEPELSRAAELHARYLSQNPEQQTRWPAAHEEYADAPGFTPEGALAGWRAVISFGGDPSEAVEEWLGTFYHRLPLLHPGLFGAGLGQDEQVVVLDVGSLVLAPWKDHVVVWPLPDAAEVPRAFVPELPNPVPGVDPEQLGQPVSVQLFFARQEEEVTLALELFAGELTGKPVEAFLVTPQAPLQVECAPPNAWGLIPKRHLGPRTRYTARARWTGGERVWSFTTGE